ncbi:hypothetical protein [Granulicella sibirica]|uniref:Uncharacterized protein n=1 Tax=Granulicella sibirica TaxID=2479048 RepID=A0A4Q0SZE6_9BACT|nr:hypothetical protein [Granulicella sibirica]RXH56645.1 hypothetical protein GRAN_3502 [Granulicella sibirica]
MIRPVTLLPFLLLTVCAHGQTSPAPEAAAYSNCPRSSVTSLAQCILTQVTFASAPGIDGRTPNLLRYNEMNTFGPGVSLGNNGGWRVDKLQYDIFNVGNRGISQARSLFLRKHAAGDVMGTYDYVYSDGGSTALSDEAIKGEAVDMGEITGYFHGSIAATTGTGDTQPKLSFISGNNWTTDGAPLLDITKGTTAGRITGPSTPLAGSLYLNTFPVDNPLPLTTAWGVCNQPIPQNHLVQVNTPFTCNLTLKKGQFQPGGQVCITGPNYPELAPIISVGTVLEGFQSITIAARNPNPRGANIFQGGICGQYISFDANLAASGYRSSYYAFGALDAKHLIYGMNIRGNLLGNTLPMSGSEAEQFGVEGLNGYHLYPGCEVITNQSLGANPICEPNSIPWSVGDLVEAPHNVAVNVVGRSLDVQQHTPSNGTLSSGDLLEFHGLGTVGQTFMAHVTFNGNPPTFYKPYGGLFMASDLHRIQGYFDTGLHFGYAPGAVVRIGGNADGSKSIMTLFALPGGDIRWDPATSTLLVDNIKATNLSTRSAPLPRTPEKPPMSLRGTTNRIGGIPLATGNCSVGTATISGATTSMVPVTVASETGAPGFSPSGAFQVNAQVTAPNTVSVHVCALISGTPRPSTYIVALQ